MTGLVAACWAEGVKLRRSPLLALTAGGICLAPLLGALFMVALRDPGRASPGLAEKAQLFAAGYDVAGYLGIVLTVYAGGGLAVCGIVTAWVFGREYVDGTVGDLLALPTSRVAVVTAKYLVVLAWCAALTALMFAAALVVAAVFGFPDWSPAVVLGASVRLAALYGLGVVLVTPVGFVACAARGYLPGVGLVLLVVVLSQAFAAVGAGTWFPWSVPAFAVGLAPGSVGVVGYLLVAITAVGGAALTAGWWRYADHR